MVSKVLEGDIDLWRCRGATGEINSIEVKDLFFLPIVC